MELERNVKLNSNSVASDESVVLGGLRAALSALHGRGTWGWRR